MKSTLWWLGLIFGTLSVVMLVKHGFDYGFVAPLQLILDFYEQAMNALFGWAEPWIKIQLSAIAALLGFDLSLYPHWKYVFVALLVYFGADARTSVAFGNLGSAGYRVVVGILIAAITGVAAGGFPLDASEPASGVLIAVAAITGIGIFDIAECAWQATWFPGDNRSWWGEFSYRGLQAFTRFAFGMALVAVGSQVPLIQSAPNPGLALLGIYVVVTAIWWIGWGARHADLSRNEGDSWIQGFLRRGGTRVGLAMLLSITGAAIFVATNAGLKLAGL